VLEWYLNSASFGHLAYGAEAAARLYLDKSAAELSLAESALLIPLASAPALNPIDSPNAAVERQREALDGMRDLGAITPAEHSAALLVELRLRKQTTVPQSVAGAFTDLALKQLAQRFGRQRLERGGLRIITSLDYALQLELTCLVRTQLRRLEGRSGQESLPDGSACQSARLLPTLSSAATLPAGMSASGALLDPRTGEVLALLGDTSLDNSSPFTTAHPPGSLLTPFAAVAAFARGYSPANLVWDLPARATENLPATTNPDGQVHGPLRLRMALANDYLTPLAQMVAQVGPANTWRLASALGLEALADEQNADVFYDGGKSTVVELAQAYSAFANQGSLHGQRLPGSATIEPITALYVENIDGLALWQVSQAETQAVVSAPLAYLIHNVLSDEQARWPTLGYPNPLEVGRPAGAKVGRTSAGKDVWAAGYLPQRVAVFWLGDPPDSQRTTALDPRYAAGLWHALIQYTARDLPPQDWTVPAGTSTVQVCDPSGQLPTPACPALVDEIFLNGNEPVSADTLYHVYQINRETGRLATVFTPPGLIDEDVYMLVPPEAHEWAAAAGIPTPPEVYDTIQPPAPSADVQITSPASFVYVRGKIMLRGSAAGDNFDSYRLQAGAGLNPQNWLLLGPDGNSPVKNGILGEWDTQGLDGLYALRLLVVRADQTADTATIQVTVDNTPPRARVLYPLPEAVLHLSADRTITFQAEASDSAGIQRLEWLVDGEVAGQNLVAPFSYAWQASIGTHSLAVRAYDLAGNQSETAQIQFSVER
jgi:membrane peptidoglycan carboxypeptidase